VPAHMAPAAIGSQKLEQEFDLFPGVTAGDSYGAQAKTA
jgi:hypothetical protein